VRVPRATRHCKDANRPGSHEHTSFDFLGYTFRGRLAKGPRGYFTGFSPAISNKARKAIGTQIRAWHLTRRSTAVSRSLLSGKRGAAQSRSGGWRDRLPRCLVVPLVGAADGRAAPAWAGSYPGSPR
jgi:hypothetical protein